MRLPHAVFFSVMKRLCFLAGLVGLLLFPCLRVEAQDDQYIPIYDLIQQGDVLKDSGQPGPALAKYLDAQARLLQFQKLYPNWNNTVVGFRLNYLASRIADLTPKPVPGASIPATATAAAPNPTSPAPVATPATAALEDQVRTLQGTVRQLQADNMMLQAKVKEAFSAQPAAVDARELAKAEDKIKSIEKENALLKVTLARQESTASAYDTNALERMTEQLTAMTRQLADQTKQADALARDKQALQTRLDSLLPAASNATHLDAARKELETANLKLTEQTELNQRLMRDKDDLIARIKTLEAQADTLTKLRAENELLKKQLSDLKSAPPPTPSEDLSRKLAEDQATIAALQSDKEILRLEKIALQNQVAQFSSATSTPAAFPFATSAADARRVKELEHERADLQKKLEAAQKELNTRKGRSAASRIEDLMGEVELLRARLGVYEAQAVPYSPEELALFKPSTSQLAAADPKAGQKSVRELPAGTAGMVAEARRDFADKQFDKAEAIYSQILRKDEKNVYTLANLAAIQLELNRLDDAEKHINEALALSPDDAYSLLVLGEIKFRQGKYSDSLNSLSRASKLDPQNAEIQNFLGLALSQEGQRKAAERAFRKAIELDPNYGSAHNNLAVFYATARPPWMELARWHYQKALAAGFPPNPSLEKLLDQDAASQASR